MPDGVLRGLPKRQDRSILEFIAFTSQWDADTITLPTGLPADAVVFIGFGTDTQGHSYNFGASQDSQIITSRIAIHQPTDQQSAIYLVTLLPDQSWPSALNHNGQQTSFESMVAAAFLPSPGFRGVVQRGYRTSHASSGTASVIPPTNVGPRPGGIAVAMTTEDAGGAGPNTPSSQSGWEFRHSGGLGVFGYRLLAPDFIETPPAFTITSPRSDTWSTALAYVV